MDSAWIKIIKVTGSVGVVGLLFSLLMNHLFSEQIVNVLGSQNIFFVAVLIICGLIIALILAIFSAKRESKFSTNDTPLASTKDIKVTYSKDSTHNGDNNF